MKRFLVFFFLLSTYFAAFAQSANSYSRIKIDLRETPLSAVAQLGLETDHGSYAKGKHLISDYSSIEIALLEENNIPYKILIEDVKAHYRNQNAHDHDHNHEHVSARSFNNCSEIISAQFDYETPSNYQFGSMGGYLTYDELLVTLDEMANLFPNLISAKQPIGTTLTHEGRPIYWLRISDNPNVEESEEPQILYNALHHAREPNSLSQLIFYMWYLLENYDSDPEVKYLVDNTEMYFIPCINPDGYVFNELTDPNGGGLWRKNRAVENGETVGVDLNRNYGYQWGFDDQGSSDNPNGQTYRGQAPFSEPETQAIREFAINHRFRICLNNHTFSNVLIYPFSFSGNETPDIPTYEAFATAMTRENNFPFGTGLETLGATANGEADDWYYGDTIAKPRVFSMTPEIGPGTFGFWPPQNAIDQLNKSALLQNLVAAHLLHDYGEAEEIEGQNFITQREGTFSFNLKKYGLASGVLNLNVRAVDNNISLSNNNLTIALEHLDEASLIVDYSISEAISNSEEISLVLSIDNGEFISSDTINKTYLLGDIETIASDDGSTAQDWTFTEDWAITTQEFVSGPSSITDSPNGNYRPNTNASSTWQRPIDLSNAEQAFLRFYAMWDIEARFDYVQVMASTDGGTTYEALCGNFTKLGTPSQVNGEPLYDGTQEEWVLEEINLIDYIGQSIMIRFVLVSDGNVEGDGFYFDDISVEVINKNTVNTLNSALIQSFDVFPNPFEEELHVNIQFHQAVKNIRFRLVNSLGQVFSETALQDYPSGQHSQVFNQAQLSEGVYFLQIYQDEEIIGMKRVVKVE